MIEFSNPTVVLVTPTFTTLEVKLTKTGISNVDVSANVLFYGADLLYPSAQQYNGIKAGVVWLAGEQGEKTVSIPLEPTSNSQEYVLASIDDALNDTVGKIDRAYILLSKVPITGNPDSKFLPTTPGNYVNLVITGPSGFTSQYVKEGDLVTKDFTSNTGTSPGSSGSVPAPPLGTDPLVLTDKGWSSSPMVITAPVGDSDLTVANTEFVDRGLQSLDEKFLDLVSNFTPNTSTAPGKSGTVPRPPMGTDPLVLTQTGWSSSPNVLTAPVGDADLTVANTEFVARGLESLKDDLSAPFTPGTSTTAGIPGIVPSVPSGVDPLVLTDKGWTSSPMVVTAPVGDADLTVANTEFVDRGLQSLDEKLSLPFTPGTSTTAGIPGIVPSVPSGVDPLVLTDKGWTSSPMVVTAPVGDADLTVANTQFVAGGLAQLDHKFTDLTKPFTPNSTTQAGTSGVVPAPPASGQVLVLTSGGWLLTAEVGITQPGMGMEWHGTHLPTGWLWQDGSFCDPNTYPNLFAVIGYSRGRSGDLFKLPDRRGRVGVGAGQGDGLVSRSVGEHGGSENVTLTLPQTPIHDHPTQDNQHSHSATQVQHSHPGSESSHNHDLLEDPHDHALFVWSTDGGESDSDNFGSQPAAIAGETNGVHEYRKINAIGQALMQANTTGVRINPATAIVNITPVQPAISLNSSLSNISVLAQGGGQAHENMPPFEVVHYIIKY